MKNISTTEIVAYNEFRAQLETLRDFNNKAVFDYESPRGNKDARSHIYKLRKTKSAVEACRKTEKAASLEYGRKVDSEAKDIIFELDEMISVHLAPIQEIENREKRRVEHIRGLIEYLQSFEDNSENLDSDALVGKVNQLRSIDVLPDEYAEFTQEATAEKERVLSRLDSLLAQKKTHEAEQEELKRLRQEAEERARKEREEEIAKQAAENARREAEQKAVREKEEAERKRRELIEAKARAEQAQIEAEERAKRAAEEAEKRLKREANEKLRLEEEEKARREADEKHRADIDNEAITALMNNVNRLSLGRAQEIIKLIADGKIPNVFIRY